MIFLDTSAVIDILNEASGRLRAEVSGRFPMEEMAVAHPVWMEVLMGARGDRRRRALEANLREWRHVEVGLDDWIAAARIYADLRQVGVTAGPMDCCIAQAALSRGALLLHRDRDFDLIARVRPKLRLEKIPAPGK